MVTRAHKIQLLLQLIGSVFIVAGCSGSNNNEVPPTPTPAPKQCTSISGGGTQVTSTIDSTCVGCTVSDPEKAADGDFDSFATVTIPAGASGTVATRATAQPGVAFPAGSTPGIIVNFLEDTSGAQSQFGVFLRTFLQGQQQEQTLTDVRVGPCSFCTGKIQLIQGTTTTKPFDAVEFGFMRGPSAGSNSVRLHEFCSDSASDS